MGADAPFNLTVVGSAEGPLEFRDPFDGEVFNVQEVQLICNMQLVEKVYQKEAPLNDRLSPQQANPKPYTNIKQICIAYYDRKIFQIESLTALEPQSVLDIEFIGYHETEIETASATLGSRPGKRQRGFTLRKQNRTLTFIPIVT
jgi:hypothetical protein